MFWSFFPGCSVSLFTAHFPPPYLAHPRIYYFFKTCFMTCKTDKNNSLCLLPYFFSSGVLNTQNIFLPISVMSDTSTRHSRTILSLCAGGLWLTLATFPPLPCGWTYINQSRDFANMFMSTVAYVFYIVSYDPANRVVCLVELEKVYSVVGSNVVLCKKVGRSREVCEGCTVHVHFQMEWQNQGRFKYHHWLFAVVMDSLRVERETVKGVGRWESREVKVTRGKTCENLHNWKEH